MYRDSNGNHWATADEAIDEFVKNLPALTGEDEHRVFQGTVYNATAEWNLNRIRTNILRHPHLVKRFMGDNYPVPYDAGPDPDGVDTSSSRSSQHYIDTGRYMTNAEVREQVALETSTQIAREMSA